MKRTRILILLAVVLCAALLLIRSQVAKKHERMDLAATKLEKVLAGRLELGLQPAPGMLIRELMESDKGRSLLAELDKNEDGLAADAATGAYVCIWREPRGQQTLFSGPGFHSPTSLTVGLPSQVSIEEVRIEKDEAIFLGRASSAEEDRTEVTQIFKLLPGEVYEARVKIAELEDNDFFDFWRSGKRQVAKETEGSAEQTVAPDSLVE